MTKLDSRQCGRPARTARSFLRGRKFWKLEYEPLFSSASHEIGLRLHLAVRFGAEGDYAVTPTFFSQYENTGWRQFTSQVLDGSASPRPINIAAEMLDDVLRYGGAAHYLEGHVYLS